LLVSLVRKDVFSVNQVRLANAQYRPLIQTLVIPALPVNHLDIGLLLSLNVSLVLQGTSSIRLNRPVSVLRLLLSSISIVDAFRVLLLDIGRL
jgi:hypothetical protein